MKSIKKTLVALGVLMLAATAAWAVDYSKMSNEELSMARGTMYNANQEEWNAFHTEWWKRLSQMTPEERQKYGCPGINNRGKGRGMGKGMGRGPGRGMGCGPCWAAPNTTNTPPANQ
jgi:hypothetical protein